MINTDTQFASTLNKKYLPGARAFLKSLIEKNSFNYLYNFFVFDEIDQNERNSLENVYPNINFIDIDKSLYNYYNTCDTFRNWGINCYNRFDIFTLKCEKVIFFDVDIIVLDSINEISDFNGEFGAIEAPNYSRLDHTTSKFFDGGVMIISKKFLSEKTRDTLIDISKQKKWSSDEPVLNAFFENSVTYLPNKYNVLTFDYPNHRNNTSILQYVGHKKPWYGDSIDSNYDDFIKKSVKVTDLIKFQNLFNKYNKK